MKWPSVKFQNMMPYLPYLLLLILFYFSLINVVLFKKFSKLNVFKAFSLFLGHFIKYKPLIHAICALQYFAKTSKALNTFWLMYGTE